MINLHGLDKITFIIFIPLFESNTLTKAILNQVNLLRRLRNVRKRNRTIYFSFL